jgi:hypothetical protein
MIVLVLVLGLALQKAQPPAAEEVLPKEAPKQPIAYSHKTHVALGLKCAVCHTMAGDGFLAGYPKEATCMGCHTSIKTDSAEIVKLAEYYKAKKAVPWVKIYSVPDYVWFSHVSHNKEAGIACETCHGPVGERDVMAKEIGTNMHSCMQCHAKMKANNGCNFCHASQ